MISVYFQKKLYSTNYPVIVEGVNNVSTIILSSQEGDFSFKTIPKIQIGCIRSEFWE